MNTDPTQQTALTSPPRRRGRPPRRRDDQTGTRDLLLRVGLETLTEKGFTGTGLEEILSRAGIPKGSFYHYFDSKEAFGLALIDLYGQFFARKLDRHLLDTRHPPLDRITAFIADAKAGMTRFDFRRGCLIGTLGQEMATLPDSFRARLQGTFADWQNRLAACLTAAQAAGEIATTADPDQLAAVFWIGWEGAVLRAKLDGSVTPLETFAQFFLTALPRP